ncbi:DoxX family protein [Altererythrobacter sp. MTPC7]|uniref:DoxX family protein n=1 Tax=Erythrobacteraceae TaxID=335929 RepID=UPI0036F30CEA
MIRNVENNLATWATKVRLIDPVFRLSLSLIFVIGGVGHFLAHEYMLDRMALSPWKDHVVLIGDASILLWLSGLVFIGAGTSLALGWMTRLSCTALFLTLVPITFAIHIAPGHTGLYSRISLSWGRWHLSSFADQEVIQWIRRSVAPLVERRAR